MLYRVTFMERTGAGGDPSEDPTGYLDLDLQDGVVTDKVFVERTEPQALHSEENLEEDDDFLSVASETWDYTVADEHLREFEDAMKNSRMVMEFVKLGDTPELDMEAGG